MYTLYLPFSRISSTTCTLSTFPSVELAVRHVHCTLSTFPSVEFMSSFIFSCFRCSPTGILFKRFTVRLHCYKINSVKLISECNIQYREYIPISTSKIRLQVSKATIFYNLTLLKFLARITLYFRIYNEKSVFKLQKFNILN